MASVQPDPCFDITVSAERRMISMRGKDGRASSAFRRRVQAIRKKKRRNRMTLSVFNLQVKSILFIFFLQQLYSDLRGRLLEHNHIIGSDNDLRRRGLYYFSLKSRERFLLTLCYN